MKSAAVARLRDHPIQQPANDAGSDFIGMHFTPMGVEVAASKIARKGDRLAPFSYVVTPNVDHMVRLNREPALRPLYDDAGLILNDSRILELLAKRDGVKLPASPGADIVEHLFRNWIKPDEPVVIIGSSKDDVEAVKQLSLIHI